MYNKSYFSGVTTMSPILPNGHQTPASALPLLVALLLGAWLLLSGEPAKAGVNLKNGNYYITYTDLILKGRHDLTIERTYNSRAGEQGLFGIGWGSDFEVYLAQSGDGTVTIHENGSGRLNVFYPPALSRQEIEESVAAIMSIREQDNEFRDDSQRREARQTLLTDAELRDKYMQDYVKAGRLSPRAIPAGTIYRSQSMGQQQVLKTQDGFQRIKSSLVEDYNAKGQLTRTAFNDGVTHYIYRDAKGRLARVVSSEGLELRFHMNENGTVARVDSSKGVSMFYEYDGKNLVRAFDSTGDSFHYRYDDNSNLTAIGYDDGNQRIITYTGKNQFVRSIRKKDGTITWYDYGTTYRGPDGEAYYTEVTKQSPSGHRVTNKYEYWIARSATGHSYEQRIRATVNGIVTDTTYDANGNVVSRHRGRRGADFEYDERGRLTVKTDGDMVIRLSYDEATGKISRVVKHPIGEPQNTHSYSYEYDAKGNLTRASNSEGKNFKLSYNDKGQIVRTESDDQVMTFVYNDIGKPVVIAIEGLGSIQVSYDSNGEIEKVHSDAGHRMALQVTQGFQTLLSLVKPAGVNLNL